MYEVLHEYLMIQNLNAMKLDWCEVGDARNVIVSYFYDLSRNCSIECLINHCSVKKKQKKCAMKQILYDTVSQTMVNRAVHSKERRETSWG